MELNEVANLTVQEQVKIYKACLSKYRYHTKRKVKDETKRVKKKYAGKRYSYYECPYCKGYHLTTFRNRKLKNKKYKEENED